ncbi:uncharacterized protein B0H18DRAFT_1031031 [Fomitopsis serialis]|uniref:uncharacterized protein n=1 Tax=Fomitopsis serialis TaxID=139415 RepID=UPI0020079390|nr:uncharacterized protein B0H18DRAFT_1031031 [Neoantrodia serialis]KAH9918496.1 hypothetical protein B0H18DRAFT_1031031 [Neoantrodia serialis]
MIDGRSRPQRALTITLDDDEEFAAAEDTPINLVNSPNMPLFYPDSESGSSPVLGLDATIRDDLGPQAMTGDTPGRLQLNQNAQLRHPVEHQLLASPNAAEKETQSYSAGNQRLASLGTYHAVSGSVSSATATSQALTSVRSYAYPEFENLRLKLAESEIENKKINDILAAREAVIRDLEEEGAQRRRDGRTLTMRLIGASPFNFSVAES